MWRYILLYIHLTGVQVRLCQVRYVASWSHLHTRLVSTIQPIPCRSKFVATFMLSSGIFSLAVYVFSDFDVARSDNYNTRFKSEWCELETLFCRTL